MSATGTARDLARRLIAGERGDVPLHLAMLLEKSSSSDHGDQHYREILPPELADLKLSSDASEEILASLCAEVARDPDHALFFAISFTGTDRPIKTAAQVFTNPPRPLTMEECGAVLSLLQFDLPYRLADDAEFLPQSDLDKIVRLAEQLQVLDENGVEEERSARIIVKMHAAQLLKNLRSHGILKS